MKGQLRHRGGVTGKGMNGDQKGHTSAQLPVSSQQVSGNYSEGDEGTADNMSLPSCCLLFSRAGCVGDVNLCVFLQV